MADLGFAFSAHAFDFEQQLRRLEIAYEASVAALSVGVERAERLVSGLPGDPKIVWRLWKPAQLPSDDDEDYDNERHHAMLLDDALDSVRQLQHAFIVLLFHLWERHSMRWAGRHGYDLDGAVIFSSSLGGVPVKEKLDLLRLLANTIKHNNSKLYHSNPDLFGRVTCKPGDLNCDYTSALIVSDDMIKDLISVLRSSGPKSVSNI